MGQNSHLGETVHAYVERSFGRYSSLIALVLVGRLPWTAIKINDCVSVDDCTQVCQLSAVDKSNMLAKSTSQVFWATSLLNQHAVGHKELLFRDTSSQRVEDSDARYDLVEAKVANFKRDCSSLRRRLNKVSS